MRLNILFFCLFLLFPFFYFSINFFIAGHGMVSIAKSQPSHFSSSLSAEAVSPPAIAREFRGAWIATVANIDWPSEPGLPVARQKEELIDLLDLARSIGLNAVLFQIRPAADALYQSKYEPWSEFLTGRQGKPPEPFYDPLAFAIEQAHARGLELHAWFNPFRARHPRAISELSYQHPFFQQPGIVKQYGRHLWLDPGLEAAQEHSLRVILDVLRRYDIDGVHIDDYFYPYRERNQAGKEIDFPDEDSYRKYLESLPEGKPALAKNDWRRDNVNRFVRRLYEAVRQEKPLVRFGVSPVGIWRPGYPPEISGFDAYEQIYADARLWWNKGWVDYFSPQLYWRIAQQGQSFPVLLSWWAGENHQKRHLWPGLYTSRVADEGRIIWPAEEISQQIELTRKQDAASGNIHFSIRAFVRNSDRLREGLERDIYRQPALVPASDWLGEPPPASPRLKLEEKPAGLMLRLNPGDERRVWLWAVQKKYPEGWKTEILPGWNESYLIPGDGSGRPPGAVAVSAVNRTGLVSSPVVLLPLE